MKIVQSPIGLEKKEYGDAASHRNGQAENIDERDRSVGQEMPPREAKIIEEHFTIPQFV
jgi:hypothetical protein